VDGDFASLGIYAHLGNLSRIGVSRRWSYSGAFERAAARVFRRSIRARAAERSAEVDGRDHGLFKAHLVLGTFFFSFLLQRSAQRLSFHAATDFLHAALGSFLFGLGGVDVRALSPYAILTHDDIVRRAAHLARGRGDDLAFYILRRAQRSV